MEKNLPAITPASEPKPVDGSRDASEQLGLSPETIAALLSTPAFQVAVQAKVNEVLFDPKSFITFATEDDARYMSREQRGSDSSDRTHNVARNLEGLFVGTTEKSKDVKARPFSAIVKELNAEQAFMWTPLEKLPEEEQNDTKSLFKEGESRPATDPQKVESLIDELAAKVSLDKSVFNAKATDKMTEAEAKNKARTKILTDLQKYNGLSEDDMNAVAIESEALETLISDSRKAISKIVTDNVMPKLMETIANGGTSELYLRNEDGIETPEYLEADAKATKVIESIENPFIRKAIIDEANIVFEQAMVLGDKAKLLKDAKDAADAVKPADVKKTDADKTDEEKARESEEVINTKAEKVHIAMKKVAEEDPVNGHNKAMEAILYTVQKRIEEHYSDEKNADIKFADMPDAIGYRRGLGLYLESHYGADGSLTEDEMKKAIKKDFGRYRKFVEGIDNHKLEPVVPTPTPAPTPVAKEVASVRFMNWSANKAGKIAGTAKRAFNKLRRK